MPPDPSAEKVIVAHDARPYAERINGLLEANGYQARAVFNGHQVLLLAEAWQPQNAVLDLSLSGKSGFEVARELRRKFGASMHLVGFTGWPVPRYRERALDAGFDEVVINPASPADILLALGGPGAQLVRRSTAATFHNACIMIESGHQLIERLRYTNDPELTLRSVLLAQRALERAQAAFEMSSLSEKDRARVQRDLVELAEKIARVDKPD